MGASAAVFAIEGVIVLNDVTAVAVETGADVAAAGSLLRGRPRVFGVARREDGTGSKSGKSEYCFDRVTGANVGRCPVPASEKEGEEFARNWCACECAIALDAVSAGCWGSVATCEFVSGGAGRAPCCVRISSMC